MNTENNAIDLSCPACQGTVHFNHPVPESHNESITCSHCGASLKLHIDTEHLLEDDFGPVTEPEFSLKLR